MPLRPLTFVEIIDLGFDVIRARPTHTLAAAAVIAVPTQILIAVLVDETFGGPGYAEFVDRSNLVTWTGLETGIGQLTAFLSFVGPLFAAAFVSVALGRVVTTGLAGISMTPGQMLRGAFRRLPVLIGAWIIAHLIIVLGLFVGVIPGLIAAIGWYLIGPVIGVEDLGVRASLRRTWRLSSRRLGKLAGVFLTANLLTILITIGGIFVPRVLARSFDLPWGWGAQAVLASITSLFTTALGGAIAVVAYLDMRSRLEGVDLELTVRGLHARR